MGLLTEENLENLTDVLDFMEPRIKFAVLTNDLGLYRDLQLLNQKLKEGTPPTNN